MAVRIPKIKTSLEVLKEYWGYTNFRGQQEKAIEDIVNNKDILFLAPTSLR